ncbi:MAG: hypothetical protein EBQ96_05550 [Proteobacteria bacterium]|nr:hypothetical protein [Pseudomonadota bacterium]
MRRFAPFNCAVDLAVSHGMVQIFEIGYAEKCGLEGFEKVYGFSVRDVAETFAERASPYRLGEPAVHNGNLRLATLNKNIFYALFGEHCPEVMPQTRIYPAMDAAQLYKAARADFKDAKGVAFKNPVINRGEGVYLANIQAHDPSSEISAMQALPAFDQAQLSTPTIAAQSLTIPDTVIVDGQPYAPTMRLILTAYQEPDGTLEFRIHGAYFRLPDKPLHDSAASAQETLVCKGRNLERTANDAAVPAAIFESAKAQLDAFFKPRFSEVFLSDPLDLALSLLSDSQQGVRLTGLEFVTAMHPHTIPDPQKLDAVMKAAKHLAETDIVARRYMIARAKDDPDTWSPVMGELCRYASQIKTNAGKPVIRVQAPVPQTAAIG